MKKNKDVSIWWFFVAANVLIFYVAQKLFKTLIPLTPVIGDIPGEVHNFVLNSLLHMVDICMFAMGINLLLLVLSYYFGKRLFLFPKLQPKLLYLIIKPIIMVTASFSLGHKIILSFFNFTNKLVLLFPKEEDSNRIPLLLLPRCLQNSECNHKVIANVDNCIKCGKCDLAPLIALKDKYKIEVFVAGGGGEAKKKLLEEHPSIVIAVACVDELILNSTAVLKYPVVAFSNEAGDAPCKNTTADVAVIEEYIAQVAMVRE